MQMKISYQNVLFTIILFSVYTCIVLKIWGGERKLDIYYKL